MPDWVKLLKDYVDTLETIVGTEGGIALASKLTAARAAFLDNINQAGLLQLTAARAGYLDFALQIKATTIDLQQIAGNYTLFTGATQHVVVEKLLIRLPNVNVSDDINITSISIQTNDATPQIFITNVQGAKVNLTAEQQLSWTGAVMIDVGKLIQLTIAGGAADAPTLCDVIAEYRAVIAGGTLT